MGRRKRGHIFICHIIAVHKLFSRSTSATAYSLQNAALRGEPYDLVILDMHMPGMNGLEVARAIKADPAIASVHLVMLSSVGEYLNVDDVHAIGIEHVIKQTGAPVTSL
jgi:CheY-like chemotaxis protein